MKLIRNVFVDTAGATSLEYAFIASMISLAALVGVQSLGAEVVASYEATTQEIRDVNS
jgi:Flp pilus assembly pilin Flp